MGRQKLDLHFGERTEEKELLEWGRWAERLVWWAICSWNCKSHSQKMGEREMEEEGQTEEQSCLLSEIFDLEWTYTTKGKTSIFTTITSDPIREKITYL